MAYALGSLVTIAGVTVALPWTLVHVAGSPLPRHLPGWDELVMVLSQPDDGTLLLTALTYVTWIAWAVFVLLLITEAAARLRRKPTPRIPGLHGPQQLAALLLTSIGAFIVSVSTSYARPAALPPVAPAAAVATGLSHLAPGHGHEAVQTNPAHRQEPTIVTVRPGESLWTIARDQLPPGASNTRIAELVDSIYRENTALRQPDGTRLEDPNLIQPGWKLRLPAAAETHKQHRTPEPRQPKQHGHRSEHPSHRPRSSTAPTTEPRTSAPHTPAPGTSADHHCAGRNCSTQVRLPSGAIVGLSLAAGIGTALVAARLHRRRRRRISPGGAAHAPEAEPSQSVRAVRRADNARRETGHPDAAASLTPRTRVYPVGSNGLVTVGTREGAEVTVPIAGLTLSLDGPGAYGVARALAMALLTHAGDSDVRIIMPRNDIARLLDIAETDVTSLVTEVRDLLTVADFDTALRMLESERIHRARLMGSHDQTDLDGVRTADPAEPLPRTIMLATPAEEHRTRLAEALRSAESYDLGALLLDTHPAVTGLHVDADGHVTDVRGDDARNWADLDLFHLTAADTRDMLATVRAACGIPEPDAEPAATPTTADPPPPEPRREDEPPVRLQVLGFPTLVADGIELTTGIRAKARELITVLALHAGGASRDVLLEALYPDVEQRSAVMRFHAALADLRRALRNATSQPDADFIVLSGDRYRIAPDMIDVDLWHLQRSIAAAHAATDDPEARLRHLRSAVDTFQADLAADEPYEWVEPEREALRRQAIEAMAELASAHTERGETEDALHVLERAREVDGYAEEIYQRIMTLQHQLGRHDAVRRTYRLLESKMDELGADPSDESTALARQFLPPNGRHRTSVR